jgi:uncharacterized membrane protein
MKSSQMLDVYAIGNNILAAITVAMSNIDAPIINSGGTFTPFVSSWKNLINPALLCGIPALCCFFFLLLIVVRRDYTAVR